MKHEPLSSTVLIVDDEPDVVTYLGMLLEDAGYRVRSAGDADAALVEMRRQRPDLISLDIMMPRRSGISLYRQMKTDPELKNIPAIVVTAFSCLEDFAGQRFRKLIPNPSVPEPEAFLEKPVDTERFLDTVVAIIGRAGRYQA